MTVRFNQKVSEVYLRLAFAPEAKVTEVSLKTGV